jgi:hypothetical protein
MYHESLGLGEGWAKGDDDELSARPKMGSRIQDTLSASLRLPMPPLPPFVSQRCRRKTADPQRSGGALAVQSWVCRKVWLPCFYSHVLPKRRMT